MMDYVGDPLQVRGAEQYTLHGGRGEGMNFLWVRNGLGLEAWISLDRAADLSRVSFRGDNMGYFAPCGYVAPQYYDPVGAGFLKSFTAGFVTTCGLTAVGSLCNDEGEELPLHGTVSHLPARLTAVEEDGEGLTVRAVITDAVLFGRKLQLNRSYRFSYRENSICLRDRVVNLGDAPSPFMILYHCNMGYPLLDEHSILHIPHEGMRPRDQRAREQMAAALTVEPPQAGYSECCYYYDVTQREGRARAGIFSPTAGKGVILSYDKGELPCFTQWKMMGKRDYVMGLEPGNCNPDGRDALRRRGELRWLESGECAECGVGFYFTEDKNLFEGVFSC